MHLVEQLIPYRATQAGTTLLDAADRGVEVRADIRRDDYDRPVLIVHAECGSGGLLTRAEVAAVAGAIAASSGLGLNLSDHCGCGEHDDHYHRLKILWAEP